MSLKLNKVNRGPHLSTLVASSISREIVQGRLQPGDQLPTEQQLATTFGVSRNVVREAIAQLRSEGRIWSQQGRGAFVSEQPNATVLTIDHQILQQASAFQSLFELRRILEVQAAAIAAKRRKAEHIAAMRDALATMQGVPYGSVAWLRADIEFHKAIATATNNSYMVQFISFVAEKVVESILVSGNQRKSEDLASFTLAEHQAILDAIANEDAVGADAAMRAHLQGAANRVGIVE